MMLVKSTMGSVSLEMFLSVTGALVALVIVVALIADLRLRELAKKTRSLEEQLVWLHKSHNQYNKVYSEIFSVSQESSNLNGQIIDKIIKREGTRDALLLEIVQLLDRFSMLLRRY